jgi:hypothetical protein
MKLHWVKRHDGQYFADSGNRAYVVDLFEVGAYDGDPTLTMYDNRYWSTCWSLTTRVGTMTRNPVRLFNSLSSAMFAAQVAEDHESDHELQYPAMAGSQGRHRRTFKANKSATITGRDGNTYTVWTRLQPVG